MAAWRRAGRNRARRASEERVRLPLPTGAASPAGQSREPRHLHGWVARGFDREWPLLAPLTAAWLAMVGIGVLLHSPALRVYWAAGVGDTSVLTNTAWILAPDVLLHAGRQSDAGVVVTLLYLLLACAALAAWAWAVRLGAAVENASPRNLLLFTALLCLPAVGFVGLFSDDVYLYNSYGRTIANYGANPLVHAPATFAGDPHLTYVYWRYLPSSYGPLWLMLSAFFSAVASDSLTAAIFTYRIGGLAIHLATALALWHVLRQTAPQRAVSGMLFYAWNPLVIVEVVANAHNDVLVALFAVLLVAATLQRAWGHAAFFGACAVMVKPFAVLLLPALALRIYQTRTGYGSWIRQTATAMVIGAVTLAALSLPLFAGFQLIGNISGNPASHFYTNTVWELISDVGQRLFGVSTIAIQHPYLDAIRTAGLIVGALWIVSRTWTRRGAAHVALSMWLVFLLTASWVWPWYFVPAIALAALSRGTGLAAAAALTAGGLLFWSAWPAPSTIPSLYALRSLLLFGPLFAVLAIPAVRVRVLEMIGAQRRPGSEGVEVVATPVAPPTPRTNRPPSTAAAS